MTSCTIARREMLAALACWLSGGGRARAAEADSVEIAVLPFFSARVLVETYEPMRAAIQARLGRPTYLVTARDFRTFALRTEAGGYGFILTAPHLGRLAQLEAGYRPLLQWLAPLRGVFMVDRDSPLRSLADLRGRRVGMPDPLAAITMMGEETLRAAGLVPGKNIILASQPSHNAALLSVLRGENAAALTWVNTLDTIEPDIRDRLRPLAYTGEMPVASVFMAGPRLPAAEADALRAALLAFAGSDAGRGFLKRAGYDGIVPIASDGLAPFDRFLPAVRRLLAQPDGER